MSKRFIFAAVAVSLSVAACSNPVSSTPESPRPHAAYDQTASPGGNMMGGGS